MNFQIDKTQKWVLGAVLRRIQQMPDFESLVRLRLEEARRNNNLSEQKEALQKKCLRLRNEASNFTEAIRVGGNLRSLVAELEASQLELAHCEFQLQQLEKQQGSAVPIPAHSDLVGLIETAMQLVVDQNDETNRLLCRILPRVTIFPVLLCNGEAVKLQAEVELDVSAAMGALTGSSAMVDDLREIVTADLFDTPAYVRYAETFGTAESRNEKVFALAERLGVSLPTAMLARRLYRRMCESGVTNPYQRIASPPEKGWRCRRHKHRRYRFDPCPPPEEGSDAA